RVEKAAQGIASPIAALEAMFMAHIDFVAAHPGVPRMIFGELQRAGKTVAKSVAQTLVQRYGKLLHNLFEVGKAQGEIDIKLDNEAAAIMFIGSIQGLVMQSLLHGDTNSMRSDASRIFLIYKRGIQSQQ
ncbi:TetR family transcriptional regulator C-terminal domain-containing protein, partial [Photobacterium phosphoreum]|uniref:TetR family transcriptional regulator C-terminal domain-containing protein n=1 Tax=Photobacterium phosphoreum TaxID=659 RepID=UPI003F66982A|nr:TetR family transcriptional regulator [Photobacterium phosphoreum]